MEPVVNWRDHFLPTVRAAFSDAAASTAEKLYRVLVRYWEVLGLMCVVLPDQTMHSIGFGLKGLQDVLRDPLRNAEMRENPRFTLDWELFLERLVELAERHAVPPECDRCGNPMTPSRADWICWKCLADEF